MKNNFTSSEKKIAFLEGLAWRKTIDRETVESILLLSVDDSTEVRLNVAETLAVVSFEKSEDILVNMLEDKSDMVISEVCNTLRRSKNKDILDILFSKFESGSHIVKGYALLAAVDISVNSGIGSDEKLKALLDKGLSDYHAWVKIAALRCAVYLGQHEYEENLVEYLFDKYYGSRIFALSLIEELCEKKKFNDLSLLVRRLNERIKTEPVTHIKERMDRLVAVCRDFYKVKNNGFIRIK